MQIGAQLRRGAGAQACGIARISLATIRASSSFSSNAIATPSSDRSVQATSYYLSGAAQQSGAENL